MRTPEFANAPLLWSADARHILRHPLRHQRYFHDRYEMGPHEIPLEVARHSMMLMFHTILLRGWDLLAAGCWLLGGGVKRGRPRFCDEKHCPREAGSDQILGARKCRGRPMRDTRITFILCFLFCLILFHTFSLTCATGRKKAAALFGRFFTLVMIKRFQCQRILAPSISLRQTLADHACRDKEAIFARERARNNGCFASWSGMFHPRARHRAGISHPLGYGPQQPVRYVPFFAYQSTMHV